MAAKSKSRSASKKNRVLDRNSGRKTKTAQDKPAKLSAAKSKNKIRYAVVGLGDIAQEAVLPAFKNARKNSELVALISGDPKKLKLLGKKYGVSSLYSYEDFEICMKSGEVDAVYIALPNSLHRQYVEMAARNGVHVLCEKPLAKDANDCQEMIKATQLGNVKFMTAYRLHFDKANMYAVETAKSGELGDVRYFTSTFSQRVKAGNIRLDADLGGGPLYDIGIYCINATRYIFREEPTEVFAFSSRGLDERFKETDEMVSVILRYPEGRIASFVCSFAGSSTGKYEIVGTEGSLLLENSFSFIDTRTLTITSAKGKEKTKTFAATDQFAPELLYFSDCIINGTEPEPGGLEGLIDLQIIEALQESIRTRQPVRVSLSDQDPYPGMAQTMTRPKNKKVKTVNADSPAN